MTATNGVPNTYRGMRWFKCDLQVQTPEDAAHWLDDDLRLGNPRRPRINGEHDESDIQEKARKYLRRCHELGLELIGVTDHNFSDCADPRDRFLTHLVEQNRSVAKEKGREPIWIFPGFEVDIGYHLLCLFAPTMHKSNALDAVDAALSALGLPRGHRFENGRPRPLRRENAYVALRQVLKIVQDEHGGIVIAAHAFSNDGICNDGAHREDFLLDELLCVEVTRHPLGDRERAILVVPDRSWKRQSAQPAFIMSSDAKSIRTTNNGEPLQNALGYRHTWIKMSEPSIKGLRQAFLDPESRIRLPHDVATDRSPAERQKHARIISLAVEGARFVEDQTIQLSPNLTCIIGGRGTGKSTLLEYMRLCLGRGESKHKAVTDQVQRIRGTLPEDAVLTLQWRNADGVEDTIEYRTGSHPARILGREVLDPEAVFKQMDVRVFSQKELSEITATDRHGQAVFLLPLIDQLCGDALSEMQRRELDIRGELDELLAKRRLLDQRCRELNRLKQEERELQRKWEARVAVRKEAEQRQFARQAQDFIEQVESGVAGVAERCRELADDVEQESLPLPDEASSWPRDSWFKELHAGIVKTRQALSSEVRAAVERFKASADSLMSGHEQWEAVQTSIRLAEEAFLKACEEKGLEPEDVTRLQEIDDERREKKAEISSMQAEVVRLEKQVGSLDAKRTDLRRLWREQYLLRQATIRTVAEGEHVPLVGAGEDRRPFIEVGLRFFAERQHFVELWNKLAPDGRTKLGRRWEELGEAVYESFQAAEPVSDDEEQAADDQATERVSDDGELAVGGGEGETSITTVWDLVESWMDDDNAMPAEVRDLGEDLRGHLRGARREDWEKTCSQRVRDSADLILYREDGTRAGSLQDGGLSDGQRNTAVLAMVLADGEGPVLIDQPEDELDSDFIYRQLVPMLRAVKERRQVIAVTHNANLPVNGDAELVYALRTVNGHGVVRAAGGLDRADVNEAVLDIMEGSREAFRRRREKYRF